MDPYLSTTGCSPRKAPAARLIKSAKQLEHLKSTVIVGNFFGNLERDKGTDRVTVLLETSQIIILQLLVHRQFPLHVL